MNKEDINNYIDQVLAKREALLQKINDNKIVADGLDNELTEFDDILMQMIGFLEGELK